MKKLLLFLPLVLLFSCSVEKRKYQKGFYVNWHNKKSKKEERSSAIVKIVKQEPFNGKSNSPEIVVTGQEKNKEVFNYPDKALTALALKKHFKSTPPPEDTCDVLVFKDGSEIRGKVKEVGSTEIKYKRCDTQDGPMYISRKSELFMIKYSNGTREVIKSEAQVPQQIQTPTQRPNPYKPQQYKRENHPLAVATFLLGILAVILFHAILFLASAGFGLGVLILPLLAAAAAIGTGKSAFNRIREQPDVWKGRGLAMPGFIMGLIIVGIYMIALMFIILLLGI